MEMRSEKAWLADFVITGYCRENCDYGILYAAARTGTSAAKSVMLRLTACLQVGSVVSSLAGSLQLLITDPPTALDCDESTRSICITGIDMGSEDNNEKLTLPLWQVASIQDCFTTPPPLHQPQHTQQYVTWSGWWFPEEEEEDEQQKTQWCIQSGRHTFLCGTNIIVRWGGVRHFLSISDFCEKACAVSTVDAPLMVTQLQKLSVGDVLQFSQTPGGLGKPKEFLVTHVPQSQRLHCVAHCDMSPCSWRPFPFTCGKPHCTDLGLQALTVVDQRGNRDQPPLRRLTPSSFRLLTSSDCQHYGKEDPELCAQLGRYAFLSRDPCHSLFHVTRTVRLSKTLRLLRLTCLSTGLHFLVPFRKVRLYLFKNSLEELQAERQRRNEARDRQLRTLMPGDVLFVVGNSKVLSVEAMKERGTGERRYSLRGKHSTLSEDFISLDSSNTVGISSNDGVVSQLIVSQRLLSVGDVVVYPLPESWRGIGKSMVMMTPPESYPWVVVRLIQDKRGNGAVLCRRLPSGVLLYQLCFGLSKLPFLGPVSRVYASLDGIVKRTAPSATNRESKRQRKST